MSRGTAAKPTCSSRWSITAAPISAPANPCTRHWWPGCWITFESGGSFPGTLHLPGALHVPYLGALHVPQYRGNVFAQPDAESQIVEAPSQPAAIPIPGSQMHGSIG